MLSEYTTNLNVVIELTSDMLGTVPKNKELYKTYLESKKPESLKTEDESITVEEIEERGWTGFHKDEQGLFIYSYMIMGFLKHSGNTLKDVVGIKALKSKLNNYCFVNPRRIYFNQDAPDGVLERSLRVMTMQGPRVTLTRSDYIKAGKKLDFAITLLNHKELTVDLIALLLEYGELIGLGQWRNGSYGRFKVIKIA